MARNIMKLRTALEFAKFHSPDIRDAVVNCIKQIDKDMEEVEYTDSIDCTQAFRELDDCITDFENKDSKNVEVVVANGEEDSHEVDREAPLVFDMNDEVDRVTRPNTDNDDDDIES